MHSAPSVSYPVGRSSFLARLLGGLWLLGWLAGGLWWVEQPGVGWRAGVLSMALCLAALGAWQAWHRAPCGLLHWDGGQWGFLPQGATAEVLVTGPLVVALDLQAHLLLRLAVAAPGQGAVWLWLDGGAAPSHWHALRCAVYSRAMTDAQPETGAVDP